MPQLTFNIKQNDTRPVLEVFLRDERDRSIDLTSATVLFHLRNAADNSAIITNGAVTQVDAVLGQVRYSWVSDNTATAAVCEGEFQVTFASGLVETFPNDGYLKIVITDDVA